MKIKSVSVCLIAVVFITGCQSTFGPEIGMTERQWLRRTLIADVAYMEKDVKAYKSGRYYYYFVDGVLVKVDEGMIPAQRIQMEIKSEENLSISAEEDKYDQLRKLDQLRTEGVITEEEFESEKRKILSSIN